MSTSASEHLFDAGELFFSTTDTAGRIQRANSTFMRLSGYPRGSLVGAAHNVVRHPSMPAGLFRSIWDLLGEGKAVGAYVTNESADGGYYRVFATIIPCGDGYLSVRTLPMLTDLRDRVEGMYERVVAAEEQSRQAGSTRREVAAKGKAALNAELQQAGYHDVSDFTAQVMPAEIAALVSSGVELPTRPEAEGPVASILTRMDRIESDTAHVVNLLDVYARLIELLRTRATEINHLCQQVASVRHSLRDAATASKSGSLVEAWTGVEAQLLESYEQLKPLAGQVEELRGDVNAVRFAVALVRLHNLMGGLFAAQLVDGVDEIGANDAVGALGELCTALHDGAQNLALKLAIMDARADVVGGELDAVAATLADTHQPLMQAIQTAAADPAARADVLENLRSAAESMNARARDLADLARSCQGLAVDYDPDVLDQRLERIREDLAALS
ncbi:chemotaxis protein [Actinomyces vulturis]|uniref:chemotaxis protein n=1 Tax=Actinomyces vulturis TaxID=1857645 RepID=UPI000829AD03|nr:chemotaxis protein [Actinomyces vulturis]